MAWFEATTGYILPISKLLKAIHNVDSQVYISLSSDGMMLQTLDSVRVASASVLLDPTLFSSYKSTSGESQMSSFGSGQEPSETILISLEALMYSLQMFIEWETTAGNKNRIEAAAAVSSAPDASSVNCIFTYYDGQPLEVRCSIGTMQSTCVFDIFDDDGVRPADAPGPVLDRDDVQLQAILSGSMLHDVLREFEAMHTLHLTIMATGRPQQLAFISRSDVATSRITLNASTDAMETFICEGRVSASYNFKQIIKVKDAVQLASRVSIRLDSKGTLSIQSMCEFDDKQAVLDYGFRSEQMEPNS